jgi:hypothetical protein
MTTLTAIAPAFVAMAHRIVWATAATVDPHGRPWTRVLHPLWVWDGEQLTGWIATDPTGLKRRHLDAHPHVALTYWEPGQDTASAYCRAGFVDDAREWLWRAFVEAPAPVGYDPSIIPAWEDASSPSFGALRLHPWRLQVQPAAVLLQGRGDLAQQWREPVDARA